MCAALCQLARPGKQSPVISTKGGLRKGMIQRRNYTDIGGSGQGCTQCFTAGAMYGQALRQGRGRSRLAADQMTDFSVGVFSERWAGGARHVVGKLRRRAVVISDLHPSVRPADRMFGRRERASSRTLGRRSVYEFLVQPTPTVVTSPNLSAHKSTGDCASRYHDLPQMPSRCP